MSKLMQQWGFLGDPKDWIGKTVQLTETLAMEYASSVDTCVLLQFTDGTRGWTIGRACTNIITGPSEKSMEKSRIITPEEYGQAVTLRKQKELDARLRSEAEDRRKYEELAKRFRVE